MGTFGMYQCTGDEGTYVSTPNQTIIGTHVDDLIGIAPTEAHLERAKRLVEGQVELDKRGKPSKMLGIELTWGKEQLILIQTGIIESMTRQFLTTPVGKKKLTTTRSALLCQRRTPRRSRKILVNSGRAPIHCQNDMTRDLHTCESTRTTHKGIHFETLCNSTLSIGVFALDQNRRDSLKKSRGGGVRSDYIRRCLV